MRLWGTGDVSGVIFSKLIGIVTKQYDYVRRLRLYGILERPLIFGWRCGSAKLILDKFLRVYRLNKAASIRRIHNRGGHECEPDELFQHGYKK